MSTNNGSAFFAGVAELGEVNEQLARLAVRHGDAAYAAMTAMVDAAREGDRVDWHKTEIRAREQARREIADEDADDTALPESTALVDLLAEPDEPTPFLIDQLWPVGGRVILAARAKAGKTTLLGSVIKSVVDREPLFGRFAVAPGDRNIGLIDTEMSRGMLRAWLRRTGIRNKSNVHLFDLRGRAGAFDVRGDRQRAAWADRLRGLDVLLLDPLAPVLTALDIDPDRSVRSLLDPLSTLLTEADIKEALLAHHMGHEADRSRGDSALRDWPDAEWMLAADEKPDAPRWLSARGRDVELPRTQLAFDPATRALTATGDGYFGPAAPTGALNPFDALLAAGVTRDVGQRALATQYRELTGQPVSNGDLKHLQAEWQRRFDAPADTQNTDPFAV